MDFKHPLARVHGLGSAKDGVQHWIAQRISAVALTILSIWFLLALLRLDAASSYADVRSFLAQPWNASLCAAFVIALFYHARLGLQVVIEDYVHKRWLEVTLQVIVQLMSVFAVVLGLFALLRITLGA